MVNKFIIIIIGVIAAMATLVLWPGVGSQNTQELRMDYIRDHIGSVESGLDVATREVLTISNDGTATYTRTDFYPTQTTDERRFSLSGDELKRLKALVFETGFMQIPVKSYEEKQGLDNYTRYQIAVYEGDSPETFNWFNAEASQKPVPPIITNIGAQLDGIIERHL
jgi:hypothetical protein